MRARRSAGGRLASWLGEREWGGWLTEVGAGPAVAVVADVGIAAEDAAEFQLRPMVSRVRAVCWPAETGKLVGAERGRWDWWAAWMAWSKTAGPGPTGSVGDGR